MIDYDLLCREIGALSRGGSNWVGLLANAAAVIKEESRWFWVGFYIVNGDRLELGPFQGPLACMSIPFGKGVCGAAWKSGKTLIVPDVERFPGHIACSSLSKSEIVVPIIKDGEVKAVLDIDSTELDTFTSRDALGLERICAILADNAF